MPEDGTANGSGRTDEKQGEHHDPRYHLVYAFGYAVLSLFVDFTFIWPESHLGALLFLAASFSLLAIYELREFPRHVTTTVIVFLFVSVPIVDFVIGVLNPPPETTVTGSLSPAGDPTPPTGCDPVTDANAKDQPYWSPFGGIFRMQMERPKNPPPKDAIVVALGGNGVIVTKNEKVPIVQIGECKLLSVQKTGDSLLIDAKVFDLKGQLRASIDNNAFRGLEDTGSTITQAGDLSTLIVREGNFERLWVRFLNRNAVQVRGVFFCPHTSSNVIVVRDDGVRMIPAARFANTPFTTITHNACTTDSPLGYMPPSPAQ
jgi:hypothetical protein